MNRDSLWALLHAARVPSELALVILDCDDMARRFWRQTFGRFFWRIAVEWEQIRYCGAGVNADGEIEFVSWPQRLEMAAKYEMLGSTHRPWFRESA